MARATLFDPITKTRIAVDAGGSQARDLFAKGYKLETPTQNANTYSTSAPKQITANGQDLYASDAGTGASTKIGSPRDISGFINQGYQDTRTPTTSFGSGGSGNGSGTAAPSAGNPADSFKAAIAALLQKAQAGNTGNDDLMKQRNALINARFNAVNDVTPENLRVLSPSQQAALASGNASGLNDQLGGVNAAIQSRDKAAEQASQTLKDALDVIKENEAAAKADKEEQNRVRDDARATLQFAITNNPEALRAMTPQEQKDWAAQTGYPLSFIENFSKTSTIKEQQINVSSKKAIPANKYHGNLVFDAAKGAYVSPDGAVLSSADVNRLNRISSGSKAGLSSDELLEQEASDAYYRAHNAPMPVNKTQRAALVDFYKRNKDLTAADRAKGTAGPINPNAANPFSKPVTEAVYTAKTIPEKDKGDLIDDINRGGQLGDIIKAYPDVDPSWITSLYKSLTQ